MALEQKIMFSYKTVNDPLKRITLARRQTDEMQACRYRRCEGLFIQILRSANNLDFFLGIVSIYVVWISRTLIHLNAQMLQTQVHGLRQQQFSHFKASTIYNTNEINVKGLEFVKCAQ